MSSGRWMKDSADPVDAGVEHGVEVGAVLRRSARENGSIGVGQADALAVGELAADLDARDDRLAGAVSVAFSRSLPSSSSSVWPARRAARISGCGRCTRVASPGAGSSSSVKVCAVARASPRRRRTCRRAASVPAGRPGCRSAGRARSSTARIARDQLAHRGRATVWLMLMRNTSAPASNSCAIIAWSDGGGTERRDDLGAAQASHRVGASGSGDGAVPAAASAAPACRGVQRPLRRLLAGLGELHRPGALLAGVDLEEAGAVDSRAPGNPRCRGW